MASGVTAMRMMKNNGGASSVAFPSSMTCLLTISTVAVILTTSSVDGVKVTAESWEEMTKEKQVFVEFVSS